jgi:3-phenylpropionate/trans-cinnamate dioxygenase ferredoxin subunit
MAKVDVGGEALVVYHLEDGFYASQRRCPHTFAALDKGKIVDGQNIRCWLHHAIFDIKSGNVVRWANFPPGVIKAVNVVRGTKDLKTFPTKVEDDKVYVDI